MTAQTAFFTTDTALMKQQRAAMEQTTRAPDRTNAPRKTLAERLIAAWLAPWTHGFTPLW